MQHAHVLAETGADEFALSVAPGPIDAEENSLGGCLLLGRAHLQANEQVVTVL